MYKIPTYIRGFQFGHILFWKKKKKKPLIYERTRWIRCRLWQPRRFVVLQKQIGEGTICRVEPMIDLSDVTKPMNLITHPVIDAQRVQHFMMDTQFFVQPCVRLSLCWPYWNDVSGDCNCDSVLLVISNTHEIRKNHQHRLRSLDCFFSFLLIATYLSKDTKYDLVNASVWIHALVIF